MQQPFLHEQLTSVFNFRLPKPEIPDSITQNLNPVYELRDYQIDAFARFIHCPNNNFPRQGKPLHLLFNMAIGSGKTLIMTGLILYLYGERKRHQYLFYNYSADPHRYDN